MTYPRPLALTIASMLCLFPEVTRAGMETSPPLSGMGARDPKELVEAASIDSASGGGFTFGYQGGEHLNVGYVDSFTPLWRPGNAEIFMESRSSLDDESRYTSSYGLGFRYIFPEKQVILGANAFYDSIHSPYGNDFNQLGLGAEMLSKWVDARFNYYLPDNNLYEVGHSTSVSSSTTYSPLFLNGPLLQQRATTTQKIRTLSFAEGAMQGFDGEVGFLIPGLDRYMQVRLFAGAYHFDNPVGSNYSGFKARLEARLLPGVTADVAYWEDAYLNGGSWTAGLRVSVPFSIGNLFTGKNPFEGFADQFRPGQKQDFGDRMTETVLRSPARTTATGWGPSGRINGAMQGKGDVTTVKTTTQTNTVGRVVGFAPANVNGSTSSGTFSGGIFTINTASGGTLTVGTSSGGTLSDGSPSFSGSSLTINGSNTFTGGAIVTAATLGNNVSGGSLTLGFANPGGNSGLVIGGSGTVALGPVVGPGSLNGTYTFSATSGVHNIVFQGQTYTVPASGGTLIFTNGVLTGGTILSQ